jgi:hypothetical protein
MGSKRPNDGILLMRRTMSHNSEVPHAFNHTDGQCPKCGNKGLHQVFCLPGQSVLPRVSGCEIDGDHLHRQCAACGYPWVERCYDQLLMSQEEGFLIAESQIMAALACVAQRAGGISYDQAVIAGYIGWTVRFNRDSERGTITITAEETPPAGKPAHPELRHEGPPPRGSA